MSADLEGAGKLFESIGLAPKLIENTIANGKLTRNLCDVIEEAGASQGCEKSIGALLYLVASTYPANALVHRKQFIQMIMDEEVKTNAQLEAGHKFLSSVGSEPLDIGKLKEAAGVGVEVTPDQIAAKVREVIAENESKLKETRYHTNTNPMLGKVVSSLKWADVALIRKELEEQVASLLGPKTEEDMKPPEKKKKPKKEKKLKEDKKESQDVAIEKPERTDPYAFFTKPEENNMVHTTINFSDGRVMRVANTAERLQQHLKEVDGKFVTRFPPEPNGYLHIGHAKAMFVDFGLAKRYGGRCYLRFDDTNPEAEKQEYIDHIEDIVSWLGWEPYQITYSSDYFHELHALAVKLIETGNAYVCHQTGDEIKAFRERREPSPWRDRPIEESLKLFEDMRKGLIDEGQATLRMKMDHKNENFNMFDLIAYRIKFVPHPKAGDEWCIYPSYDFTHCIVDSLENITHSLCTLEFETRRASYYWLLEVLDLYKPLVWEYSRLNITHTVLSKRKLNRLVTDGYVSGWDDPRLMTLAGLRRRGVTPNAINMFCQELGITRSDAEVHPHLLEYSIRADLDATSPRALGVLRPLKVVIENLPDGHFEEVEARVFPGRTEETYKVPFTKVVFIERTDFKMEDERGYYGLAPGKSVMLRYAYPITCTGFSTNPSSGEVTEVRVEYQADFSGQKPPKGVLNWVGQPSPGATPPTFEARLFDTLFKSASLADDWLADLNPESRVVVKGCYATPHLAAATVGERFQLERLGYFCVDPDTASAGSLVLNRTVTLKDSYAQASKKK